MNVQQGLGALAVVAATAATAQSVPPGVSTAAIERAYLRCIELDAAAAAAQERLDERAMVICAVISKELQVRRFDDDFARLHAWTQAMKAGMRALAGEPIVFD